MQKTDSPVYVHYGFSRFDPALFIPIQNSFWRPKPEDGSGLWASRVGDPDGWKAWCEANDFMKCREKNSFKFRLTKEANVLYLNDAKQLEDLPRAKLPPEMDHLITSTLSESWAMLDYELMAKQGIDAIEMLEWWVLLPYLKYWDCNSIIVMNPNIIVPLGKEE